MIVFRGIVFVFVLLLMVSRVLAQESPGSAVIDDDPVVTQSQDSSEETASDGAPGVTCIASEGDCADNASDGIPGDQQPSDGTPPPMPSVVSPPVVVVDTPTLLPLPTTVVDAATVTLSQTGTPSPTSTNAIAVSPTPTATPTRTLTPTASATPSRTPVPTVRFTTGGVDLATPIPNNGLTLAPFSGLWSGTTSQGKPISFTVDGTTIKSISVGWLTAGCGAVDGQTSAAYSSNAPEIGTDNRFSLLGPQPAAGAGLVIVNGAFASQSSAGGQVIVTIFGTLDASGAACGSNADVSWTASAAGH